jgi:hypothetical protein
MASTNILANTCVVCAKPATTHCAGCISEEITKNLNHHTPTLYCGQACQRRNWASHKEHCKLAQAQTKLFRAGEILQEAFLATRAEAFDFPIARVERQADGDIHVFDSTEPSSHNKVMPLSITLSDDPKIKQAVLSYCAGGDTLSDMMTELGCEVLKGMSARRSINGIDRANIMPGYPSKVEEVRVRVFDGKVKMRRHAFRKTGGTVLPTNHVVLRVTLADGSTWAVDPAGAQHDQYKPVMRFSDYSRGFIAQITASRQHDEGLKLSLSPVLFQGRLPEGNFDAWTIWEHWRYQAGELWEWEYKHTPIADIVTAKREEYITLKKSLVAHLTAAARDYVNLINGDPTSPAMITLPQYCIAPGLLSEEDRGRNERRIARIVASMDPEKRKMAENKEGLYGNIIFA